MIMSIACIKAHRSYQVARSRPTTSNTLVKRLHTVSSSRKDRCCDTLGFLTANVRHPIIRGPDNQQDRPFHDYTGTSAALIIAAAVSSGLLKNGL